MKNTRLTEKLILYFVLLGLTAILIVSVVSFYSTKKALINRTFSQLTSLRTVMKNRVEQFYSDRTDEISFLAGTLGGKQVPGRKKGDFPFDATVRQFLSRQKHFSAFYILDENGVKGRGALRETTEFPAIDPVSLYRELSAGLKNQGTLIRDLVRDKITGRPCQMLAASIPGTGSLNGRSILVLVLPGNEIDALMQNNDPLNGLGRSGETFLVGPDHLMRSASRFQPGSVLRTPVNTPPASEALAGRQGTMTTGDYRDIPVLSSYQGLNIPGLNWAILAEIDVEEAMIPIYQARPSILLLSTILLVGFFVIVLYVSRRITKPLIRLKDAANNLGKGQFDQNLPVTTHDEIGALTESFNRMAQQIKEKTAELQRERVGRMRSVIDGEEMERQRLSRELHDGIGQQLIAITLRLESLLYQDTKDIRNSIRDLKKHFDQIIDEVRRISNNLMPSVLEIFSIPIAFRNLFNETEEHGGPEIHFEAKGNFDDLDKKLKTYIYRLTQEALNNIVKHAEAGEVWVNLDRNPDDLTLVIRDNGKGFNLENTRKDVGNGIHNMRERVSLLLGKIDIRSVPGKGTTITIKVPIIITNVKNPDFPRG